MAQAGIFRLSLTRFNLQACLDDIAGRCEVGCRHTRNGACGEKLENPERLGRGLAENFGFQMRICREIDRRERNYALLAHVQASIMKAVYTITKQTCASPSVQTHQTQVLHNPEGRTTGSAFDSFSDLALNLQADLDDFKRIGEHLMRPALARFRPCLEWPRKTHHLTSACRTTSNNFMAPFDLACVFVRQETTNQVVHGQLNSFLRCHTNQLW